MCGMQFTARPGVEEGGLHSGRGPAASACPQAWINRTPRANACRETGKRAEDRPRYHPHPMGKHKKSPTRILKKEHSKIARALEWQVTSQMVRGKPVVKYCRT